jgi:hypothetical protein
LFPDKGKVDPAFEAMLASGQFQMEFVEPAEPVWMVAALKHAYLGACLCLGEVPQTELADKVRAELVAVRDLPRGAPFPESSAARPMRVAKSYEPAQGPAVALVAIVDENGVMLDGGISFAGTLFVSWPLDADLFWKAAKLLQQGAV